jgi:ABC-type lipoprotein export system ATPase subunit
MNFSILVAKNLHKSFVQGKKTLEVLRGINISFKKGCSYAIRGVSGSGKSTLMHILGGLDIPSNGTVFYDKHNIFKLGASKKEFFLNRLVGFVFQFHYLIKELNVLQNIALMGLIKKDPSDLCEKKAMELLESIGLKDIAQSYPTQLSGGQLQRVAILRAIFNKPSFLLADEPTGDLDEKNASVIVDLISRCQKEWGMGIIMCTHDKSVYERMEKVFTLHEGVLEEA